jgi:hypothetical protein
VRTVHIAPGPDGLFALIESLPPTLKRPMRMGILFDRFDPIQGNLVSV